MNIYIFEKLENAIKRNSLEIKSKQRSLMAKKELEKEAKRRKLFAEKELILEELEGIDIFYKYLKCIGEIKCWSTKTYKVKSLLSNPLKDDILNLEENIELAKKELYKVKIEAIRFQLVIIEKKISLLSKREINLINKSLKREFFYSNTFKEHSFLSISENGYSRIVNASGTLTAYVEDITDDKDIIKVNNLLVRKINNIF